jgi:hypothetical protein
MSVATEEIPIDSSEPKEIVTENSSTFISESEKPSPAPASIHSVTRKSEDAEAKVDAANGDPANGDDEIQYPPLVTKVAVGIGLALAVFLVLPFAVKKR